MNMWKRSMFSFSLLILTTSMMPLHADINKGTVVAQYVAPGYAQPGYAQPGYAPGYVQPYAGPPPYGTQSEYYYNQNNPYAPSTSQYGFYGGFYGSPPPPTPAQAFPDKAAADNLYRYIQSR